MKTTPKGSLLVVLGLIEKRPSMYLGWDDNNRRKQLDALESFMCGYSTALRQHNVAQEDQALDDRLETFLRARTGADNLSGISQICATSPTEAEAWTRVWALIEEFRAEEARLCGEDDPGLSD